MDKNSTKFKTQQKIARISMAATVILIASVIWVNHQRNVVGDKTLTFERVPMMEAMATIEQTYLSEVIVTDSAMVDCFVSATYTDKTLDEVLLSMQYRYRFELVKNNPRKYTISGGRCRIRK